MILDGVNVRGLYPESLRLEWSVQGWRHLTATTARAAFEAVLRERGWRHEIS